MAGRQFILLLIASCIFAPTAPAERLYLTPSHFDWTSCQSHLAAPAPTGPAVQMAGQVLSWMALSHPSFTRALANADRLDTFHGLLHLPLGYLFPPERIRRRFRAAREGPGFAESTSFHVVHHDEEDCSKAEFKRLHGVKIMVLDGWDILTWEEKAKIVSDVLTNVFITLGALNNSNTRWGPGEETHPHIKIDTSFFLPKIGYQRVHLDWPHSFSREDLNRIAALNESLDHAGVRIWVTKLVMANLPRLVRHHHNISAATANCADLASAREEFSSFEKLDQFKMPEGSAAFTLIIPPTPASKIASDPVPDISDDDVIFDVAEVSRFIAETQSHARDLSGPAVNTLWQDLHRAGELVTHVLMQVPPPSERQLSSWAERAKLNGPLVRDLTDHLKLEARGHQHMLSRITDAAVALDLLRQWIKEARDTIESLRRDEHAVKQLTLYPAEQFASSMAYADELFVLTERSLEATLAHRAATFGRTEEIAKLNLILVRTLDEDLRESTGQTRATERPAREILIEVLDALAGS